MEDAYEVKREDGVLVSPQEAEEAFQRIRLPDLYVELYSWNFLYNSHH
jgi:hypothetical protein